MKKTIIFILTALLISIGIGCQGDSRDSRNSQDSHVGLDGVKFTMDDVEYVFECGLTNYPIQPAYPFATFDSMYLDIYSYSVCEDYDDFDWNEDDFIILLNAGDIVVNDWMLMEVQLQVDENYYIISDIEVYIEQLTPRTIGYSRGEIVSNDRTFKDFSFDVTGIEYVE